MTHVYMLVLTVWTSYPPQTHVMDHDLTGEDCVTAMEAHVAKSTVGELACVFQWQDE